MPRKLLVLAVTCLGLALAPTAGARLAAGPIPWVTPNTAPLNLHAFLLRADEPVAHVYPRTPSFTWDSIKQPGTYEFQLSMSRTFDESQILFGDDTLKQPAISIPIQLPWMTGQPYALWAHVRFKGRDGHTTPWSAPFGFNMRWNDKDVPSQQSAPLGLVRWAPVDGATAYEVLYTDPVPSKSFYTTTNVADEREYWTFHQSFALNSSIHWRVRAVRYIDQQKGLPNGLPAVSYGPWSSTFTTVIPPNALVSGPLTPISTISDVEDTPAAPAKAHELMPGFAWKGTVSIPGLPAGSPLYRVYVSTDDHCVNTVFTGAIVGGPAYAPRIAGGPFALPQTTTDLAKWQAGTFKLGGSEGQAFNATGDLIVSNEDPSKPVGSGKSTPATLNGKTVARTDLWDSGWPNGRYYWTVIPVSTTVNALAPPPTSSSGPVSQPIEYHEVAVPQDACVAGRLMSFGKISQPVVAESATPFASGVSPNGRMVAAVKPKPTFHGTPIIAWEPATGAQTYEVQWSRKLYPWKNANDGKLLPPTPATSAVLPVSSRGLWYYRVRGINPSLPAGAQNMSWSKPVAITISGDVFQVVK